MNASPLSYATDEHSPAWQRLVRTLERLAGVHRLVPLYETAIAHGPVGFWPAAVAALGLRVDADPARLAAIPRDGGLLVIANHPFGIVDGLVLGDLVARTRGPFRLFVHHALTREPRLADALLPVRFDGHLGAARHNVRVLGQARRLLAGGGTVVLFPAGGIATAPRGIGRAADLAWKPTVGRLVRETGASVLPVYVHGQNGALFHLVSHVSLTARLGLVLREALRARRHARRRPVRLSVGLPIPAAELTSLGSDEAITAHLRTLVHLEGGRWQDADRVCVLPDTRRLARRLRRAA